MSSADRKDPRRDAVEILKVLSYYYSFRDLEKILGIHFQSLWRYATLNSVPEKETAERILSKIAELNLLRTVIERELERVGREYHVLPRSPGFVSAFAYTMKEVFGPELFERISSVIALSPMAISLSTAIGIEADATICFAEKEPKLEKNGIAAIHYKSSRAGELRSIAVPRKCLDAAIIMVVDVELSDVDEAVAIASLARRSKVKAILYSFIVSPESKLRELERRGKDVKAAAIKTF